ncbi:MAG: hypothetical protein IJZ88_08195 [Clostridia bacterium]|nr:hypothetical protein [Clostridia bacterium]
MRTFFNKSNAFNAVFFLAVFVLALIRTFIFKDDTLTIATILGVLTFVFSILNTITNIFDAIIKCESENLINMGDFWYELAELCSEFDFDYNKVCEKLKKETPTVYDFENVVEFCLIKKKLNKQRKWRRIFFYVYYFVLSLMLIYLFIASDLSPYMNGVNLGEWTLWSFVIILFEILLKDAIAESIINKNYFEVYKTVEKLRKNMPVTEETIIEDEIVSK